MSATAEPCASTGSVPVPTPSTPQWTANWGSGTSRSARWRYRPIGTARSGSGTPAPGSRCSASTRTAARSTPTSSSASSAGSSSREYRVSVGVQCLQQSADHRLGRAALGIDAEADGGLGGQVSDPLCNRLAAHTHGASTPTISSWTAITTLLRPCRWCSANFLRVQLVVGTHRPAAGVKAGRQGRPPRGALARQRCDAHRKMAPGGDLFVMIEPVHDQHGRHYRHPQGATMPENHVPAGLLDVVVVSYWSSLQLTGLLTGLPRDCTVTVVDNAEDVDCDTRQVCDDNGARVTHLPLGRNTGFGYGCNVGARNGNAPFILFVNPDCRVDEHVIGTLLATMEDEPTAAACAPLLTAEDSDRSQIFGGAAPRLPTALGYLTLPDRLLARPSARRMAVRCLFSGAPRSLRRCQRVPRGPVHVQRRYRSLRTSPPRRVDGDPRPQRHRPPRRRKVVPPRRRHRRTVVSIDAAVPRSRRAIVPIGPDRRPPAGGDVSPAHSGRSPDAGQGDRRLSSWRDIHPTICRRTAQDATRHAPRDVTAEMSGNFTTSSYRSCANHRSRRRPGGNSRVHGLWRVTKWALPA